MITIFFIATMVIAVVAAIRIAVQVAIQMTIQVTVQMAIQIQTTHRAAVLHKSRLLHRTGAVAESFEISPF